MIEEIALWDALEWLIKENEMGEACNTPRKKCMKIFSLYTPRTDHFETWSLVTGKYQERIIK